MNAILSEIHYHSAVVRQFAEAGNEDNKTKICIIDTF